MHIHRYLCSQLLPNLIVLLQDRQNISSVLISKLFHPKLIFLRSQFILHQVSDRLLRLHAGHPLHQEKEVLLPLLSTAISKDFFALKFSSDFVEKQEKVIQVGLQRVFRVHILLYLDRLSYCDNCPALLGNIKRY